MLSLKYNSIHYANYLNSCDLNYKYFLKSIKETPSIEKIILELPTNKFSAVENNEDDYQTKTLLKCFLALYFTNLKLPYINCNKFKSLDTAVGSVASFQYAYLQTFNSPIEKLKLLLLLLNENDFQSSGIKNLTKFTTVLESKCNDSFNFRLDIQSGRIVEYKEVLNVLFSRNDLQKVKVKLNIIFKNFSGKMISTNEFKSFFFMWNV